MRRTMETLMDTCYDVKIHLQVGSFEVHYYEDGSYVDFKVNKIQAPKTLNRIIGNLEYRMLQMEGWIVIRVFEDYCE